MQIYDNVMSDSLQSGALSIREATICDLEILYKWRTDQRVYKFFFNARPIDLEVHTQWFQKLLTDKTKKQYLVFMGLKAIGQVRFDLIKNFAEIDISIDPEMHGLGFGQKVLSLALDNFMRDIHKPDYLAAKVLHDNQASINLFKKLGFVETKTGKVVTLLKVL